VPGLPLSERLMDAARNLAGAIESTPPGATVELSKVHAECLVLMLREAVGRHTAAVAFLEGEVARFSEVADNCREQQPAEARILGTVARAMKAAAVRVRDLPA
jgi:hypothetical protein